MNGKIHTVYASYVLLFLVTLAVPALDLPVRGLGMLFLAVLPTVLVFRQGLLYSRFWQATALAHVCWGIGQISWMVNGRLFSVPVAFQDLAYWLFKLGMVAAVLYRPHHLASTAARRQHLIDIGIAISIFVFYITYFSLVPSHFQVERLPAFFGSTLSLLMNAIVAAVAVVLAWNARSSVWGATYRFIAQGLVFYTTASFMFQFGQTGTGDPFWCATFWSMALAVRHAPARSAPQAQTVLEPRRYGLGMVTIAAISVLHVAAIRFGSDHNELQNFRAVLTIGEIFLLLGLSFLRQKVTVEESDLRSSLLDSTLNSIRQPIYLVDTDYRISRHNDVFAARFTGDSTICYTRVFGREEPCSWCRLEERRDFSAAVEMDSAAYQLEFSAFSSRGAATAGIELLVDMSLERKRQQQLIQTERMAALGRMIAGTAHELNNPLAIVLGNAQLLKDDPALDGDGRHQVSAIGAAAERARDIVQTFLTLSRPSAGEKALVDLVDVIQSVEHLKAAELRSYGIEIELDLPDSLTVLGKYTLLQEVFLNLVDNARDAIREKRRGSGLIIVSGKIRLGDIVHVEVWDNGIGVTRENRNQIFDIFFSTKQVGQGTGLGLSIARSIVVDHGGRLDVDSDGQSFTRFEMEFPHVRISPASSRSNAASSVLRVLLVDDEPEILGMLEKYLSRRGHHVQCTTSGARALHLLARNTFDVVVIDYRMPEIDGRTIVTRLKTMNPPVSVRAFVLSGDTMNEDTAQFLSIHNVPMISKPVDLERLVTLLGDEKSGRVTR